MQRHWITRLPLLATAVLLTSCETLRFYGQAAGGQWEILRKSRPNRIVAADPATSPELRRQLAVVEDLRRFATDHLALPGAKSYGNYADLGRKHVVWVLYAAPEFSLKAKKWHYPAVGDMNYRGYFRETDANALATRLRADGYDVYVGGVDAYSTLGWFHDPVLNTFVKYHDIDLAETIFHELTHRKVFRRGDTVFNESLAEAVAQEGVQRWLRHQHRDHDLWRYRKRLDRIHEFHHEIERTRRDLEALYASGAPVLVMRRRKAEALGQLRDHLHDLHRKWGGHGLETWLNGDINNGHLVSLDLYADQIPVFRQLLKEADGDFATFFRKAASLKRSPPCRTNVSGDRANRPHSLSNTQPLACPGNPPTLRARPHE